MNSKFLLPLFGAVVSASSCFGLPLVFQTQDIPATEDQNVGVLNIGWFSYGGEGVSYHDNNSSMYKDEEHKVLDPNGAEYACCNAGAYYFASAYTPVDYTTCFRYDECVDVTNYNASLNGLYDSDLGDGFGNYGYDLHNICMAEPGEWMIYHINVLTPGYYTLKCLTTTTTSNEGSIGMAVINGNNVAQNGNVLRSWADHNDQEAVENNPLSSFALSPLPFDSCGRMYDGSLDPTAEANNDELRNQSWLCWGWSDCGVNQIEKEDLTVLFKYAGEQDLLILVSPDTDMSTGDFGNFAFTLKSTDIPDFEYEATAADGDSASSFSLKSMRALYPKLTVIPGEASETPLTEADAQMAVYPNPSNGVFTVASAGNSQVEVFNAMGAKVFSQSFADELQLGAGWAKGLYIVRVTNANGSRSFKQEIQ